MAGEPGLLRPSMGYALRAALRAFKFVPDKFVEQGSNTEPRPYKTIEPQKGALLFYMAGELGFEPRLAESESAVLPLDDSPKFSA